MTILYFLVFEERYIENRWQNYSSVLCCVCTRLEYKVASTHRHTALLEESVAQPNWNKLLKIYTLISCINLSKTESKLYMHGMQHAEISIQNMCTFTSVPSRRYRRIYFHFDYFPFCRLLVCIFRSCSFHLHLVHFISFRFDMFVVLAACFAPFFKSRTAFLLHFKTSIFLVAVAVIKMVCIRGPFLYIRGGKGWMHAKSGWQNHSFCG